MEQLGSRLGQAVGKGLQQEGLVVVALLSQSDGPLLNGTTGSYGKNAYIIGAATLCGHHKVAQGVICRVGARLALLLSEAGHRHDGTILWHDVYLVARTVGTV